MIQLRDIARNDVVDIWPSVLPYINRALESDDSDCYNAVYIMGKIVDGVYDLWVGMNGKDIAFVGVTRMEYFEANDKLACLIMWLAGSGLYKWRDDAIAQIESWAIDQNADELRIVGRPGWERVMKDEGFRKTHTILAKPLGGKQ